MPELGLTTLAIPGTRSGFGRGRSQHRPDRLVGDGCKPVRPLSNPKSGQIPLLPAADLQWWYRVYFAAERAHRLIRGGVGHNLPQETPQGFAQAIVDVDDHRS